MVWLASRNSQWQMAGGPTRIAVPGVSIDAADRRPARDIRRVTLVTAPVAAAHDRDTRRHLASWFAEFLGVSSDEVALSGAAGHLGDDAYAIPERTLSAAEARAMGITEAARLYGGVVPHAFVANKCIMHGLVHEHSPAPPGWSHLLARRLEAHALPGYSAFSHADAWTAGRLLLTGGSIRLKRCDGAGGLGQTTIRTESELYATLRDLPARTLAQDGIVIERNLQQVQTFSIGAVHIAGHRIAYHGEQFLTEDRDGQSVYGGSRLHVVRGDFDVLHDGAVPPELREALDHTIACDRAIAESYPGYFASRRNYDVAHGIDDRGVVHCGVLEQSWRIGGATAAELAALEYLDLHPGAGHVVARTCETYRVGPVPAQARVYFEAVAGMHTGPQRKYVVMHDADPS